MLRLCVGTESKKVAASLLSACCAFFNLLHRRCAVLHCHEGQNVAFVPAPR